VPPAAVQARDGQADALTTQIRDLRAGHGRHVVRPHVAPKRWRFAPGSRVRTAPPGYRRYGARPRDWQTRGCIMVGPIWFCP
jgi:hypothetical protein